MPVDGTKELAKIILHNVERPEDCVFLHPKSKRNYTDDELASLTHRDFETRLFMTGTPQCGDTVFLMNHHTDNAQHASNFNYVRDYLKAFHVVKNWTCAKSVMTTLLSMCFQLEPSGYYSFASSIASGLSREGANITFEREIPLESDDDFVDNAVVEEIPVGRETREKEVSRKRMSTVAIKNQVMLVGRDEDPVLIRRKLCFLMDAVFKRLAIRKFLVDDGRSNIYRLIHCQTKYAQNKNPIIIAVFAFILQISLTLYVILQFLPLNIMEMEHEDHEEGWGTWQWGTWRFHNKMLPLALTTSFHSFMIAIPNFHEYMFAYRMYGRIGPIQMMDFIMSAVIPLVLTISGFIVIYQEPEFIEGVLNSTALLFIPEIDDQLPSILGLQTEEIVKNFLVAESVRRFHKIAKLEDADFSSAEMKNQGITTGVQFSDFYITNMPEQGITDGTPFQPYQVLVDSNQMGHQINPSSFVTKDCLLKRIEWKYTTGYPHTTNPRVGYLHLTKVDDSEVEIVRKKDPQGKVGIADYSHSIDGLFIITTFQMSEDVLKLRVCGSYNPPDFLKAFDCYSLWDVSADAKSAISSLAPNKTATARFDRFSDA